MNNLTNLTQGYENFKGRVEELQKFNLSQILDLYGNISVLIDKCGKWLHDNPTSEELDKCRTLFYSCQNLQTQITTYMAKQMK